MLDLTISLIQTDLYWEEIEANLSMFEEKIWQIEDNIDLIVLPEMFTTGFSMNAEKMAEPVGGKTFKWLRKMAAQKKSALIGSYIIKEGSNYFNRLYMVFPDGSSEYYDKRHTFNLAGEGDKYSSGSRRLIVDYKGWKICPMICYDLRFPVWARSRKIDDQLHEYDLLLYVANWPDTRINAWDALLKSRAIENHAYCVGVNRVGKDAFPKEYPGHSAVYSFSGEEMTISRDEEQILTVTLSSNDLDSYRNQFPFQEDGDEFQIQ
ncbi:MAG: amidohydrolase [Ekhidna sp.]